MNRRWTFAWRMSFRLAGWMFPVVSVILLLIVMLFPNLRARSIEIVIPLIAALQSALLFSPDDEPALEIMLASPRPAAWLMYERVSALLIMQFGIGLVWTVLLTLIPGMPDFAALVINWLPPAIALIGLALAITLMMRRSAFGILAVIFIYAALLILGDAAVTRWNFAFPLHLFLQRDLPYYLGMQWDLSPNLLYAINRAAVTAIGIGCLALTLFRMRSTEWLLGAGRRTG